MIINLEIPQYNNEDGLVISWAPGFTIAVSSNNNTTSIRANREGLVSLAIQLLTLAQDEVKSGTHIHYDPDSSLEENSIELVIEKIG